jgi:hypothetical protein
MNIRNLPAPVRFRRCALAGLAVGVALCIRALVGMGLIAASDVRSASSILPFLAVYLGGGTVGGLLVALAAPLLRWVGGAFIVGVLATVPMALGITAIEAQGDLRGHWLTVAVIALFIGGGVGAFEWLDEERRAYKLTQVWLFAGVCSVVAWIVGLHWAGQWPAVVAIFLFLIPVMVALMVTFARAHART